MGKKSARFQSWRPKSISYLVDSDRTSLSYTSCVVSVFKVLLRTNFIALLKYSNGSYSYVNAIYGMYVGQIISPVSLFSYSKSTKKFLVPGSLVALRLLDRYSIFSNLKLKGYFKPKYALSGGTYCQLIEKFDQENLAIVKLPTGLNKLISLDTYVIIGRNSNISNNKQVLGKAGVGRQRGIKPISRGVARNPVDHPNGGRTKTNKPEKSLWGWVAKNNC